ncbi:MAG: hypothetical protein P8Y65_07200, partial [Campylobacterales bacterium]
MKSLSLSGKLSLLIVAGVILSVGVLGLYFDGFLKENYRKSAQKRIQHGFFQINSDRTDLESELKKGIEFVQTDEPFLASIDLVNNYQDKQHYNAVLLDEEKKRIVRTLLDKVKFSLNTDIALYDRNEELIAYVYKKRNGYCLNFISYEHGEKMLYSRCENEKTYTAHPYSPHTLIRFRHAAYYTDAAVRNDSIITYHHDDGAIIIRSHRNIVDAKGNIEAHIEMSHMLGSAYFKKLSDNLGLSVTLSDDSAYADTASRLQASISGDSLTILQNDTDYIGVASHPTFDKDVYLVIAMNKAPMTAALDDNRRRLLVIIAIVIGLVLLVLRLIMHKNLIKPLDAMMKQIRKIEAQDYSISEPLRTGDELELISRNVNRLAGTIRERESALRQSQINFKHLSFHDPLTDL